MKNISLFWPAIYKEEWLAELGKVFSTRWIGQGPLVDEFEKQFGKKFNFKYPITIFNENRNAPSIWEFEILLEIGY